MQKRVKNLMKYFNMFIQIYQMTIQKKFIKTPYTPVLMKYGKTIIEYKNAIKNQIYVSKSIQQAIKI